VTFPRLLLAWLPVAVWFVVARVAAARLLQLPALVLPSGVAAAARAALPQAAEAVAVTLFAALWFDSLGSGGWWLLFALVGALVAMAPRFGAPSSAAPMRRAAALGLADTARYVVAGAILAWRLG